MEYQKHWKTSEAPRDRRIWLEANILEHHSDAGVSVRRFEGVAKWSETSLCWEDIYSSALSFHSENVKVLSWMELAERAQGCSLEETDTTGAVYSWLHLKEPGFYAIRRVWHGETRFTFCEDQEGPFATRGLALEKLVELLTLPVDTKVVKR